MNKKNVTISISIEVLDRLNECTRKELPDKSALVERLLKE